MNDGMLSGWGAVSLTRRVLSWFAAAVATMAVAAVVAPGEAHAFAWKDVCTITVINNTGGPAQGTATVPSTVTNFP